MIWLIVLLFLVGLFLSALFLRDHKGLDSVLVIEYLGAPQVRVALEKITEKILEIHVRVGPGRDDDVENLTVIGRDSDGHVVAGNGLPAKNRRRCPIIF